MRKLEKILIFTIMFLTIVFLKSKVEATSISISPSRPKVGDKVTVTVTVPNVHTVDVTAKVSGVASGTIQVVGGDMAGKAKKYSSSATYKCSKEGAINVNVTGDSTAVLDGKYVNVSASKSVKVSKKENTNNSNNTSNANTSTTTNTNNDSSTNSASSEATLKNLGITPHDFSGFKKEITAYSVSVPNKTEKISIYATPSDSKAQVTGTGSKSLKEGKNTYAVKVVAPDKKTTKTYTLTITRKSKDDEDEETSKDATLRNLGINPKKYDFSGFKMGTTNYSVEVPNEVEEIYIYGYATDENAKVSGLGSKKLEEGKNTYAITVTAEDKKTTKTYNLIITRKAKEDESETNNKNEKDNEDNQKTVSGITNIEIEKYKITPVFTQDNYEYTVNVPDEIDSLDIKTEKTDKNIEVEIAGNESLSQGKNIITVLVHNNKDDSTTTYQINAIVGNEEIDLSQSNYEMKTYQENIKKQLLIVKGTIIAIIVLIIVFLVQRYKLQQHYDDYNENDEEDYDSKKLYNIEEPEEEEEQSRTGRYKGKRFK